MSYYDHSEWPAGGQATWDHQTPPPARSGASSAIPREDAPAFAYQLEEVDRAIDNLVKSGKMFGGAPGGRRESLPNPGPFRQSPGFAPRVGSGPGSRPHSMIDYNDSRGPHGGGNLQNFYASQRHQSSRGSNEAEQIMQAKRRMAAQRERELRNYHQEQQFNRTVLADVSSYNNAKTERTMSPGGMSEDDRRELIARQRSALYGEGPFAETPGYVDETGTPRTGLPATAPNGSAALRGHSPLAYEYGRTPPAHPEGGPQPPAEGAQVPSAGANERSRANSSSSPQSNPPGNRAPFDTPAARDSNRTSASSPGGSPPRQGAPGSKLPTQGVVAPIGTRPSISGPPPNPALSKRSTTPLPSPLSQGYTAPNDGTNHTTSAPSNPTSAATEGPVGLGGWGARPAVWGSQKSSLGVQASVWG